MIKCKNVNFAYEEINEVGEKTYNEKTGLKNINLHIKKGECVVLCGVSGCGKTTLSRVINGLIPHFYEGKAEGETIVSDVDIVKQPIAETAKYIGSVFQNPRTQFFNVDTTSEIAFGCENLGMEVEEIEKRIEEAAEKLDIQHLMDRSIFKLSGGEKQRIACGSVYATHPDVFVMDEPSSSLDKKSIDQLQKVIETLKSMGKTIVIAEHRLYYLKDIADRFVYMKKARIENIYTKKEFLKLTNKELREKGLRSLDIQKLERLPLIQEDTEHNIHIQNLKCTRGKKEILKIKRLDLYQGEIVALIGDNGAGKTTLAHCLCGLIKYKGTISIKNKPAKRKELTARSFMVMQDVNSQLFTESVTEELTVNIKNPDTKKVDRLLQQLDLEEEKEKHPMALSGGQKQRVAIASAMMAEKDILVYDEPTSGLDWENMNRMSQLIRDMEKSTFCTMMITHDIELILSTCHRVIHLEKGEVIDNYQVDDEGVKKLKKYFG